MWNCFWEALGNLSLDQPRPSKITSMSLIFGTLIDHDDLLFSQFVQSFFQNDEVGSECQSQVFMIAWPSVWPIYRITSELVSKKFIENQKTDKEHRWGSVCSSLWGILKPWVLMRGFSTIIAASFCFADDFRTASKSTQIPNKDPQKRRSKFLVNYIFLWQDWRVAVNRICHNNLGHTITYSRICGA